MKHILIFLTVVTSCLLVACSENTEQPDEAKPRLLWINDEFRYPESPVYDPVRDIIFVSNMGAMGPNNPGHGFISKMTTDGKMIEREWVTGLLAPNGMAIRGNRLFLVDLKRLLVFDADSGEIIEEYPAPEAPFLDGLGVDETGETAYVADWIDNKIRRLSGKEWGVWLESPLIVTPNAMVVEEDRLLISTFGVSVYNQDWIEGKPPIRKGNIVTVDRETKEVGFLGEGKPIAHSDGFKPDGKGGYLLTDYIESSLLHVDQEGNATQLLRFDQCDNIELEKPDWAMELYLSIGIPSCGPADMQYFPDQKLLLIPLLDLHAVAAYEY